MEQRVALIHDFLLDVRGAERVFAALVRPVSRGGPVHRGLRPARDGGTFRASERQHVVPAAVAADRAHVPPAAAALPLRDGGARPRRATTSSCRARAPGRTASSPIRDAVHVCYCHNPFRYAWNERERRWRAARPAARAALRVRLPALAPVGLDRRPARRPLHRELRRPPGAHPPLLRPRGRRHLSAGGDRALHAGAGRRRLPRPLGADAAQAHRPRGRGVQPPAAAARRRRRRARRAAPAADGRADRRVRRAAFSDARGRRALLASLPRARRHRDRGVRHRRGRGPGRGPAGHRAAPRAACARRVRRA